MGFNSSEGERRHQQTPVTRPDFFTPCTSFSCLALSPPPSHFLSFSPQSWLLFQEISPFLDWAHQSLPQNQSQARRGTDFCVTFHSQGSRNSQVGDSVARVTQVPSHKLEGHSPALFLANWHSPWPNSRQAALSPFCDSAPLMGVILQSPDVASILLSQSSENPPPFLPDHPRYLTKSHPPPCRRAPLITQSAYNESC